MALDAHCPDGANPADAPAPWVERREIGPCSLYLADATALLARGIFPVGAAIIADPPYGQGFVHGGGSGSGWAFAQSVPTRQGAASRITGDDSPFDPRPWLEFAAIGGKRRSGSKGSAALVGSSRVALCGAEHFAQRLPAGGAWYCWDKSCGGGPADSFSDAEFIWMSARNARRVYRHQWKGRLRQGESGPRLHVSEKPVALMAWMIETVRCPVGAVVVDPYMGSGTTGIACLRTGRRFVGCEIEPDHYGTACERIESAWRAMQDGAANA